MEVSHSSVSLMLYEQWFENDPSILPHTEKELILALDQFFLSQDVQFEAYIICDSRTHFVVFKAILAIFQPSIHVTL